jgi:hypothetical protein
MGLLILLLLIAGGAFYFYRKKPAEALALVKRGQASAKSLPALGQSALIAVALFFLWWASKPFFPLRSADGLNSLNLIAPLILLVSCFPLVALVLRREGAENRELAGYKTIIAATRASGYSPPIALTNYYGDSYNVREKKGVRPRYEFSKFTDMPELLEQRAKMPLFRVLYQPSTYLPRDQREARPDAIEWTETLDGNTRLGTDLATMPVFLQMPQATDRLLPYARWRFQGLGRADGLKPGHRGADLRLFVIAAENVHRLKTGPIREELIELTDYETKEVGLFKLMVGVRDGQFRRNVAATSGGGTAEPVGLAPSPARPVETDKL